MLLKKFFQHLGPKPNWTPLEVQKKCLYKNNSRWNIKQKLLKDVRGDEFFADALMHSTIQNGFTFLVCCQTKNLKPVAKRSKYDQNVENARLECFLDEYDSPFIWSCGRSLTAKTKNPLSKPKQDDEYFEIPDLDFDCSNREMPLKAKCKFQDIIMVMIFNADEECVIMVNSEYHTVKRARKHQTIKQLDAFNKFVQKKPSKNAEIDVDLVAGTSGLSQPITIKSNRQSGNESSQPTSRQKRQSENESSEPTSSQQVQSGNEKSQPISSQQAGDEKIPPRCDYTITGPSESELDNSTLVKAGRKRKTNSAYNQIKFSPDYITVITQKRKQQFVIEPIRNKLGYLSKDWVASTVPTRQTQWEKIFNRKQFDLFDRVANDEAKGLRFFRFHEVFPDESQECIVKEWSKLFPNSPFPNNLAYIIFDSEKTNPYTG